MDEFALQFLEPVLSLLPLGQIADETSKIPLPFGLHFADGQFDGKGGSILAFAHDDASLANDPPFARPIISLKVSIMCRAIGIWHQHTDVPAHHLVRLPAEHFFRSGAELMDQARFVDHDHGIGHGIQDGTQVGLASRKTQRGRFGFDPRALKPFPPMATASADDHESNGSDDASAFDWAAQAIASESRQSRPLQRRMRRP